MNIPFTLIQFVSFSTHIYFLVITAIIFLSNL